MRFDPFKGAFLEKPLPSLPTFMAWSSCPTSPVRRAQLLSTFQFEASSADTEASVGALANLIVGLEMGGAIQHTSYGFEEVVSGMVP